MAAGLPRNLACRSVQNSTSLHFQMPKCLFFFAKVCQHYQICLQRRHGSLGSRGGFSTFFATLYQVVLPRFMCLIILIIESLCQSYGKQCLLIFCFNSIFQQHGYLDLFKNVLTKGYNSYNYTFLMINDEETKLPIHLRFTYYKNGRY